MKNKGFTLIELLIVILIIGILAVAFLPSILGAPVAARDTKRIADLTKIQKILLAADVNGTQQLPSSGFCINDTTMSAYLTYFNGAIPVDPLASQNSVSYDFLSIPMSCAAQYGYIPNPGGTGQYLFGLYTRLEDASRANMACSDLVVTVNEDDLSEVGTLTDDFDACYAILVS